MDLFVTKEFEKRFILSLVLVAVIAVFFWTGSRYPALGEKAMMSGAIQLEDPLSFEAFVEVRPEYPVWKKVAYSTINWINTNKKGMTFGVLFGAAFLTLFNYLKRRSFEGRFANSLAGLGFGAPLGVCVNCAAPIAKAMYSGGARAESTLAAMIASPTLNIVVLTMLFSLLPFYMAVTKIALSLAVILLAVPLICRFLPQIQMQISPEAQLKQRLPVPEFPLGNETLVQAAIRFAGDFTRNLWYIFSRTVPLMFVAGFLGALIATLVPVELLAGASFSAFGLVAAAVIGTILPVPIGFDVVASGALLGGGLDKGYVMVLLFTLGIFSIYSYFIVAGAISMRAASMMAGTVIIIGIIAGYGAHLYHDYQTKRALRELTGFEFSLISAAHAGDLSQMMVSTEGKGTVTVDRRPFSDRSPAGETNFTRTEAWKIGIDKPVEFSLADMWPPFWEGRSLAAGDYDNDGDIDVVSASTERGLYFYANDNAGKFSEQMFDIGDFANMPIFNAVLVDIDNDGWLDLFIATYQRGNHLIKNDNGTFDFANAFEVANRDGAIMSLAVAFGDPDRDGDLDAALGNWAAGWYRRIPGEESRNRIIFNENGVLDGSSFADLSGIPGETLSILFTDIDLDGDADLLVANDFEQPDIFYRGNGNGGFSEITRGDNIIPMTTTTTMSVKTADLHNDGSPEIYLAQIAGRSSGVSEKLKLQRLEFYCDKIERADDKATCETNMAIKTWYKSGNSFDPSFAGKCRELTGRYHDECRGMLVKDLAIQNDDPSLCELIPANQLKPRQFCDIHFKPIRQPTQEEIDRSIPQILRRNVLLSPRGDGSYEERAEAEGLDVGGWSWDVKIADFDNDGFQDVYVINGTWVPNEVSPSNLFFRNNGDGTFSEQSGPFGLEDYLISAAGVMVDLDNDGDLDVITQPVNGPTAAFINNDQNGNSVAFSFDDRIANRFGIGTRIEIRYGTDGKLRQQREIQLGGGFMSFDAPIAHFGLGNHETVDQVIIHWTDGAVSTIESPLTAGAAYKISRE